MLVLLDLGWTILWSHLLFKWKRKSWLCPLERSERCLSIAIRSLHAQHSSLWSFNSWKYLLPSFSKELSDEPSLFISFGEQRSLAWSWWRRLQARIRAKHTHTHTICRWRWLQTAVVNLSLIVSQSERSDKSSWQGGGNWQGNLAASVLSKTKHKVIMSLQNIVFKDDSVYFRRMLRKCYSKCYIDLQK